MTPTLTPGIQRFGVACHKTVRTVCTTTPAAGRKEIETRPVHEICLRLQLQSVFDVYCKIRDRSDPSVSNPIISCTKVEIGSDWWLHWFCGLETSKQSNLYNNDDSFFHSPAGVDVMGR
jgi:hypothetical protein